MATKKNNPNLSDLLNAWQKNIFIRLNCHALGTIEAFDASNQTASVSINYLKSYETDTGVETRPYPLLLDVPIIVVNGGGASLTFPIAPGDTCLVLFNDRDIDNWFASGQTVALKSNRAHALADGIALVGLNSLKTSIEDYDENRAVLRKGSFAMGVGDKLLLTSNYPTATQTLNTRLQDLVTQISALALLVNGLPGGTNTISASVLAIGLDIGDLLE